MKKTENIIAGTVITGTMALQATLSDAQVLNPQTDASQAIRPFKIQVSNAELSDLKKRLGATRWPDRELVKDETQGVQFATMQSLVKYWAESYDWRKIEAKLNALPQFMTTIDGVDIHFIHVRSKHKNALP